MVTVTVRKAEKLSGEVCAPPSKAYTQRMLIAASLSAGTSRISGPLNSEDTEAALGAVEALGAKVHVSGACWTVEGASPLRGSEEPIDCGESGATLRFMVPVAALAAEPTLFLLGKSLEQRPIEPLLQSLKQLGVETSLQKSEDRTLVRVQGGGIPGGKTSISGDVSSQFISGLMFASPKARKDTEITLTTPLESKSYVQMTREILAEHGVEAQISKDFKTVSVPPNQTYKPRDHVVPGDFSSAAFLLAASAMTRSEVTVKNLDYQTSVQGDKAIVGILKKMGVKGKVCNGQIEINGEGGPLEPVDVNAKHVPDLVPVLAALACHNRGTSRIRGAQRLRYKESDRLLSLYLELRKMGADISMSEDGLTITGPCTLHGTEVDPHNDHRIAMALAVAALSAEGETRILNAECVKKSYPRFFSDLSSLGVDVVGGKLDW